MNTLSSEIELYYICVQIHFLDTLSLDHDWAASNILAEIYLIWFVFAIKGLEEF